MARPVRRRRIFSQPKSNYFKPAGIRLKDISIVVLFYEEFEALRLKDLEGKDQKEAALLMGVSQSTFHRIVIEARKKIAEALVKGNAIKIEGGNYTMKQQEKDHIKIAVSSSSDQLEGDLDSRFGRCSYFLIVTLKDDRVVKVEPLRNLQDENQGGAGIAAAKLLANQNIDALVTGNIGPRALEVLKQFDISVYQFQGTIKDAVNSFIEKKLTQIKG